MTLIRVHKTSHSSNNSFKMFLGTLIVTLKYLPLLSNDALLKAKFMRVKKAAIFSLEKIIYSNMLDSVFLKDALFHLVKILPLKKYLYWLSLIEKEKKYRLYLSIRINYLITYLIFFTKNV